VRLVESIAEGGSPLIRCAKKFEKEKKLLSVETVSGLNQRWRCGDVEMWRCGDVEMWRCGGDGEDGDWDEHDLRVGISTR